MNYFELYDIPVSFIIDKALLKKKFIALSREYHPDFYTDASEEEQNRVLDLSTLTNEAYKVLSKDDMLIPYVLEMYGKGTVAGNNDIPNEFLMEMMDLNEQLMDIEMDEDLVAKNRIKEEILDIRRQLEQEMQQWKEDFEKDSSKISILERIKEVYLKLKYINRIENRLN